MGDICFNYCKDLIDKTISVDEGRICKEILDLYNKEGIVVEPAGAISLACLDQFSDEIKGKKSRPSFVGEITILQELQKLKKEPFFTVI